MSAAPTTTVSGPPPQATPGDPRRILLIVDDEEGPRESLNIVFKPDYEILLAENGAKAIELIKRHKVDTAVLDIRMPGMSGVDVLREIKRLKPDVQVVMLTAYETADTLRQALRLGACDYLDKPFDVATMRAAVATAMERKQLTERIKGDLDRLQKLEDDLNQQRMQYESMKSRGEIYASIIHDLNSPLTIISGLIEIIREKLARAQRQGVSGAEAIQPDVAQLGRQVISCIDISRRYLTFLRPPGNESYRVEVGQLLEDVQVLLREHPDLRENQLEVIPPLGKVEVEFNGTDMIQILLNLIINALQCQSSPHTVKVFTKVLHAAPLDELHNAAHTRVLNLERFRKQPPYLSLSIRDTGPGISPVRLESLFENFQSTKPAGKGTGLGLAIVRRFVTASQAALSVRSSSEIGTTFTLYLPVTSAV